MVRDYRQAPTSALGSQADAKAKSEAEEKQHNEKARPANRLKGVTVLGQHSYPSFFTDHKDYEWAHRRSEWVGICSYIGYEKGDQIDYLNPPTALFHTLKCLKGPPMPIDIPINFKFYDQADAQMPEGWHFTENKMPPMKSTWIIFIPIASPSPDHEFYTYDGCYGRQIATEENIAKIEAINETHNRQAGLGYSREHEAQSAQAQVISSPAAEAYALHEDALKCNIEHGNSAETETEYKWLLAARPTNALMHYNYAVLLKDSNKKAAAAAEYEKAAVYDGSNADFVGSAGQMFFYLGNYTKAYQYLGKAVQMPGGEKYKAACELCREYLKRLDGNQPVLYDALPPRDKSPGQHKPIDDDDN